MKKSLADFVKDDRFGNVKLIRRDLSIRSRAQIKPGPDDINSGDEKAQFMYIYRCAAPHFEPFFNAANKIGLGRAQSLCCGLKD